MNDGAGRRIGPPRFSLRLYILRLHKAKYSVILAVTLPAIVMTFGLDERTVLKWQKVRSESG